MTDAGKKGMGKNFISQVICFAAGLFLLSLLVFFVSRLAPGDPLLSYYGNRVEKMSQAKREEAERRLGLNEPLLTQYAGWLKNALKGDFGLSFKYKTEVKEVIWSRLGNTLVLGGSGFLLIFGLALLLGGICALHEDKWPDRLLRRLGILSSCIPEFWLSLLLIFLFCAGLKILPGSGAYSPGEERNILDRLAHLILPLTVVVTGHMWYYAYLLRNCFLEEIRKDYVLLEKAKGLRDRQILFRHCLRAIFPSYLNIAALSIPHIIGGTYIVEMVFSYPGLGTLCYESARYKDYPLLMLLCLLTGGTVLLVNLGIQLLNTRIDPRLGRSR